MAVVIRNKNGKNYKFYFQKLPPARRSSFITKYLELKSQKIQLNLPIYSKKCTKSAPARRRKFLQIKIVFFTIFIPYVELPYLSNFTNVFLDILDRYDRESGRRV